MKIIKFLVSILLISNAEASCQKAYQAYKRATLASPVTKPAISTSLLGQGAYSTGTNLTAGAASSDAGVITAGSANGLAFTYEGHFYLEIMSSNLRHYRGRSAVLKILNQAELGLGEELEDFLDDLNDSLEEDEIELYTLVDLINQGNKEKVFCPKNKELYTLKNLRNFLINRI